MERKGVIAAASAVVLLSAIVLLNVIGYLAGCRNISVFAAAEEAGIYETRSLLLIKAMDELGVCSAQEAALVWAKGLKQRSAALQYSVMSSPLKEEYASKLEKSSPRWVTGVSSPWVEDYGIKSEDEISGERSVISLAIRTRTSTGPAGEYQAMLTIVKEGSFWRIESIKADKELSAYMGVG